MIKVLGIDVGTKTGWSFYDKKFNEDEIGKREFKSLAQYKEFVKSLILRFEPDVVTFSDTLVLYGKNVNHKSIRKLCACMDMIELACEEQDQLCYITGDSEAKKFIESSGKPDTKKWARKLLNCKMSQDEADSMMFSYFVSCEFKTANELKQI